MRIVILDAKTLGEGVNFDSISSAGELTHYSLTAPDEIAERIRDAEVVIVNKIRLNESNLCDAKSLKLICVAATGYDNIDTEYCRHRGIAVCNVVGYSTDSVAQLTVSLVLNLMVHMAYFTGYVRDGSYTASGVPNCLSPVFSELAGKTWGVIGAGNIGMKVAQIADAFGCRVLLHCRHHKDTRYPILPLDQVCAESDILSIHTPLNDDSHHMINADRIACMKDGVILVNVARGAVTDEGAVVQAVLNGKIGGFGTDVYSVEPFGDNHPIYTLRDHPKVCLTPHMAWGALEARQRCINEMAKNIRSFYRGEMHNRIV